MIGVLYQFARKELVQTLRDRRMRVFLFVMPVVQLVLFGYALSSEVRNTRLGIEAPPGDSLTHDIYRDALGSGWFVPAVSKLADPAQRIAAGDADAVLVAPRGGLERAMERGGAQLQLLVDASNVTRARAIESYLKAIVASAAARRAAGQARPARPAPSLNMAVRVLFNPEMDTATFMVPGIMAQLVTLLTIVLTSNSLAREKERGTFETLVAAPVKVWELILGKSIPYFLLGTVQIPIVLAAGVAVFGVPVRGSLLIVALASMTYLCATVSLGTLIATFCRNQQQATLATLLVSMPAIILSGILYPVHTM
ncbi:MAG: ABC transporter permease, partial [SAR324 cluster bacterium]